MITMVAEIAFFALFCLSYFKADDYPTNIDAVLALVFLPLLVILIFLSAIASIIVIRRIKLLNYNTDDGVCELTTEKYR